jgi:hypothetical protein
MASLRLFCLEWPLIELVAEADSAGAHLTPRAWLSPRGLHRSPPCAEPLRLLPFCRPRLGDRLVVSTSRSGNFSVPLLDSRERSSSTVARFDGRLSEGAAIALASEVECGIASECGAIPKAKRRRANGCWTGESVGRVGELNVTSNRVTPSFQLQLFTPCLGRRAARTEMA